LQDAYVYLPLASVNAFVWIIDFAR